MFVGDLGREVGESELVVRSIFSSVLHVDARLILTRHV